MKMVKSLLLGSAAGLVAVTAGQAADLPVKARPVQYVKVCSLYGAGFYYMPGTDMCIKIGGWVRAEATWGINGSSTTGLSGSPNYNNRYTNNLWTRERGYITADAREQTAYGVARGYIAVGVSYQQQWHRGSWFGHLQLEPRLRSVGGLHGRSVGVVLRLLPGSRVSLPRRQHPAGRYRRRRLVGVGLYRPVRRRLLGHFVGRRAPCQPDDRLQRRGRCTRWRDDAGHQWLDSGGSARPPPGTAAGSRPTSSAICASTKPGAAPKSWAPCTRTMPATTARPLLPVIPAMRGVGSWAVASRSTHRSSRLATTSVGEVNYTQGAVKYLWNSNAGSQTEVRGATEGLRVGVDCVFGGTVAGGNATGCQLTTACGIDVAYEHYWTPQWHQSFVYNAHMGEVWHGYRFGQLDAVRR